MIQIDIYKNCKLKNDFTVLLIKDVDYLTWTGTQSQYTMEALNLIKWVKVYTNKL